MSEDKINVVNLIPKELLLPKYVDVLIALKYNGPSYQQELSWSTMVTYSYIYKIIDIIKENKFITIEKVGRTNIIALTEKGLEVADYFIKILECFGVKLKGKVTK